MVNTLRRNRRLSRDDRWFYAGTSVFLGIILLLVGYPLIYIVSASFSAPAAVTTGKVFLWPVDLSVEGYAAVFRNNSILLGYANSIFYTAGGTLYAVIITIMGAYALSRKSLPGRNIIMFVLAFTMLFDGGIVPRFILMRNLNLLDTRLAMILPRGLVVYNLIIARTYFQTNIPQELLEASRMDGCSDFRFLVQIVLPLSKAVIAVLALFYAVMHWNSFFDAFLYLQERRLFPLQIILREILVLNTFDPSMLEDPELAEFIIGLQDLLKYSLIIVATVPVMLLYPLVQRHFVKGVMIGAIKG